MAVVIPVHTMKSTLIKATPLLALASFAFAQERTKPLPETGGGGAATAVRAEPATDGTFSFSLKQCSLTEAVEKLQETLDALGQTRMNLLMNVPNAESVKVPALTLRKVQGPDAMALIATAAGCELKPILRVGESGPQPVIGWELRAAAKSNRLWSVRGGGPGGSGMSGAMGSGTPPPVEGGAVFGSSGPGFGSRGSIDSFHAPVPPPAGSVRPPVLGEIPVLGELFVTPLPPPEGGAGGAGQPFGSTFGAGGDGDVLVPRPPGSRFTRVYPLGTVTSHVKFSEVEQTLRAVLDVDGVAANDVKLGLHDKTNIMVVNGTVQAHALIGQLVEALGRDAVARDAQQNQRQLHDVKEQMERLHRQLAEREMQIKELEKARAAAALQIAEMERELKLPKGEPRLR